MKKILPFIILIALVFITGAAVKKQDSSPEVIAPEVNEFVSESQQISPETNIQTENMNAIITTNQGVIELELFANKAPKTVENFTKLAADGFYNGTKFHRIIAGFMIQGGDPNTKDDDLMDMWGSGGPGYQFEDEIHDENFNVPGSISMANAGPNTNGSQFFINVADNSFLNTKHTVFGQVKSGLDVVDALSKTETGMRDIPVEPVIVESITIQ